jgi:hypothetical protein
MCLFAMSLPDTTEDNYEKELDYAWTHQYGQERCECRPNAFLSDSSQEDDLDHFKDCAREFAYSSSIQSIFHSKISESQLKRNTLNRVQIYQYNSVELCLIN